MEVENMTTFEEIFKRASYKLENEKYIDYSEEELKDIFEKSRIFSKKLIDQEEANKENW